MQSHRSPASVGRSSATSLEDAFLAWLGGPVRPDELQLDGPDAPATPLTRILGTLALAREPLPAAARDLLGYRTEVSVGQAVTDLLLAVRDPVGPQCRTYEGAVAYLRDHHDLLEALGES